jgi:hypothetical protein
LKEFYIEKIEIKKENNEELYEKLLIDLYGKKLTWEEVKNLDSDKLISLMIKLGDSVKIKESKIDINKLADAIQHSRSGFGLAALTEYECKFCSEKEIWSSTAVPNLCKQCSYDMALNFVLNGSDVNKDN